MYDSKRIAITGLLVLLIVALLALATDAKDARMKLKPVDVRKFRIDEEVEPEVDKLKCADLTWVEPMIWFGGQKLQKSYSFPNCSTLQEQNDLFKCTLVEPFTVCENDTSCQPGQYCAISFPPVCVTCKLPPNPPYNTFYNYYSVMVNVTQSMLEGQMWTYSDFYNHTGVDLINTQYRYSWSPDLQRLQYDYVQQSRSTWGGEYDSDRFGSFSTIYLPHNRTHTRVTSASITRITYDQVNTNSDVYGSGPTTVYYPRTSSNSRGSD